MDTATGFNFALLIPLFLAVIFAGIGLLLIVVAVRQRQKAKAAEGWPTTAGRVLSAALEKHVTRDRDEGVTYTRTTYEPVVQYEYSAIGQPYQGNKIAPGGAGSYNLSAAQNVINRYPAGSTVTVHYNPDDPRDAFLETKAGGGTTVFLIVGTVFLVVALAACCVSVLMLAMSSAS